MQTNELPFTELLLSIADNRGRTCPTSPSGRPLIATNCISNERLYPSYDTERFVSDETYRTWFRAHPEPGDIIFVCKGSPGRVAIAPDPVDFCIAQDMVAVRANPKKIYPRYLLAVLRSQLIQDRISNMHVGTLIPHFKKGDFDKLNIPVVGRTAQELIGDTYFEFSEKIEHNRRTAGVLEKLARAVFKAWFVDFEPVKAKAAGQTSFPGMPPAAFAALPTRLVESALGPMPDGWEVRALSNVCNIVSGGTPKRSVTAYWCGDIPWYSVKDAPTEGMPWVDVTEEQITQAGLDGSAATLVPKGCTIISARGTVGRLALAARPMTFNQSCYGLLPTDRTSYRHLYLLLREVVNELKQRTHGSVFDTITRQTFDGVNVTSPSPVMLNWFEQSVAPIFDLLLCLLKESTKLAALRDYLLPRLLSGKVRVRAR